MKKDINKCIVCVLIGLIVSSAKADFPDINSTSADNVVELNNSNVIIAGDTNLQQEQTTTPTVDRLSTTLPNVIDFVISNSCKKVEEDVMECRNPGGTLDIQPNKKVTYNFILDEKEEGMIHFTKDNIPHLGPDCSLAIGDNKYDDHTQLQNNNIHLFNSSTTMILNGEHLNCSFKMFFRISLPYISSTRLFDLRGTIEPPIDPDALQNYRPWTTFIWYLQPLMGNCFLELTVTMFDLGSSSDVQISPETESIPDHYDFLSIGLMTNETNIYNDDYTFFGKWNVPATELLTSCSARITFSSKMHFQNSTGFRINYRTTDAILPEEQLDPPTDLSTWVAVNGATITHEETIDTIFPKIKQVIMEMANNYLNDNNIEGHVRQDNVTIYEVGTCSLFYCRYDCMAFYFSIEINDTEGRPIFTTQALDQMVANTELIIVVASFQVCHEIPYINWSFPIFFLLLVVICSCGLISLAVCEREDVHNQKRRDNLRYLISEWDTTWKRQSFSDINTSSASSQAPFVKKRSFFHGFGYRNKPKTTSYPKYEITEFKEFKSKPVDANAIGLNEVLPHTTASKPMQFSNQAFTTEDEEIFNKYSGMESPATIFPESPNIVAEQSFQAGNPFRHQMMMAENHP